jgi:hypothetical protein
LAGRFNRWFGSAAVASQDPTAIVAVVGEIERERGSDDERDDSRGAAGNAGQTADGA